MSAAPFISVNNVSIRVRERILFENLSWEIFSDQHWAVIGPNGAGKSTLMRAIAGSLPTVSGKITYHFNSNGGAIQDHIAHVTFEPPKTMRGDETFHQARWNAGLGEEIISVSDFLSAQNIRHVNPFQFVEAEPDPQFAIRQAQVIEQLGLAPLLDRNIAQLSNGERRKVTIARALLKNPRLLILDNPFNGLDEQFRKKFSENLDNLMCGELRVIIVGTSQDELPREVTHTLSLHADGKVVQELRGTMSFRAEREISGVQTRFLVANNAPRNDKERVLVQMQNVTISYNGRSILHEVNWVVREHEHWALLGPNGAGKTTLLSLILADNPQAYANDITLFGKQRGSGESIWEIKQNIGWVAPELQLYYPRNATSFDVVCSGWFDSLGLYRQCTPEQRAIAQGWLERLGFADHAQTAFPELSEGEQRIALLARAMVKNPALLVLDEPCQGLDAVHRAKFLGALADAGKEKPVTLIYVTHRAEELPASITHVLRLEAGRVVD